MPLSQMLCRDDETLLDVMSKINENGKGIVFVSDARDQFLGVITDGDIRRGLLNLKSLKLDLCQLINRNCLTADHETPSEEIIVLLKSRKFEASIVPLLKNGKVVDYFEFKSSFYAPVASPVLAGNEMSYVVECIATNWISSQGRFVNELETEFAAKYGSKYAVTTMNGTTALHLALVALGVGPGDEVIVPSLTFAASINAILYTGATPVLVDVDPVSWCLSAELVKPLLTSRTKAIMPVHLYGQVAPMDDMRELASSRGILLVEDTAEAQGAKYRGQYAGTMSDIGCFSFFGNKIMTTGEGGMCVTDDEGLYKKMRLLRDHGMKRDTDRLYYHEVIGFNYRMTNLQAAIGLAQLERIDEMQRSRSTLQKEYLAALSDRPELKPQQDLPDHEKVCWLVAYTLEGKAGVRDRFIRALREHGVDSRPFFYPLHKMPAYQKFSSQSYPVSEHLSETGLNFPSSIDMSTEMKTKIFQTIHSCLATIGG